MLRAPDNLLQTAEAIARIQLSSGSIPWGEGRHSDPWNHIEAAMGLDTAGLHDEARRAYLWLAELQRSDGSWAAAYLEDDIFDPGADANFVAYVAAGTWHHFLATGDSGFLTSMWPTVQRAIGYVLGLQRDDGAIDWARDSEGLRWPEALITSSSCILLSLRAALAQAAHLGMPCEPWKDAAAQLEQAVRDDSLFAPRRRYAMDWYYPVLSGALSTDESKERLASGWDAFVKPGRGSLCVLDEPWVTAGESSELVLACCVAELREEAEKLMAWIDHLRDADGLYWTGRNHTDNTVFPYEKTTWSAGAVLLAADALWGEGPAASFFTDLASGAGLVQSL